MISLNGIEKIIEKDNTLVHALKEITLNVEQGEIFGIVGRKGAGKSALIRCINLLDRPSRGSVILDSCELTTLSNKALRAARRHIGMIFQHVNLLSSRTVFENIALPLEISRVKSTEIHAIVQRLLELTDLTAEAHLYPQQLSKGQKQAVAIARALANQPKILLCEEATADLDYKSKQLVLKLLRRINQELNLSILILTHDIEVIKSLCHRAAVLHQGAIVEQGTVLQLFSDPQNHATRELIKTSARSDLPMTFKHRLSLSPATDLNPIVRISIADPRLQDSLLPLILSPFQISLNIIQAHLESIRDNHIGVVIAELIGKTNEIEKAIEALNNNHLHTEVLGYAARHS